MNCLKAEKKKLEKAIDRKSNKAKALDFNSYCTENNFTEPTAEPQNDNSSNSPKQVSLTPALPRLATAAPLRQAAPAPLRLAAQVCPAPHRLAYPAPPRKASQT